MENKKGFIKTTKDYNKSQGFKDSNPNLLNIEGLELHPYSEKNPVVHATPYVKQGNKYSKLSWDEMEKGDSARASAIIKVLQRNKKAYDKVSKELEYTKSGPDIKYNKDKKAFDIYYDDGDTVADGEISIEDINSELPEKYQYAIAEALRHKYYKNFMSSQNKKAKVFNNSISNLRLNEAIEALKETDIFFGD